MIIKLNREERKSLDDRMIAFYFLILKYIQTFQERHDNNKEAAFYSDRFSLKNFLQEFNVIRNLKKDIKNTEKEERNIIKLVRILEKEEFSVHKIDNIAAELKDKGISKINAISMISKICFLEKPETTFIYDRFVKRSIGFNNTPVPYKDFYNQVANVTNKNAFKNYMEEIENDLIDKLQLIEKWTGYTNEVTDIRKMRIFDTYLMFLGQNEKCII
jgi:hypothetical protein